MKTTSRVALSFDELLYAVRQLPRQKKIRLSRELEKDAIGSSLSRLLKIFKTKDLTLSTITQEVEQVRRSIYEKRKR